MGPGRVARGPGHAALGPARGAPFAPELGRAQLSPAGLARAQKPSGGAGCSQVAPGAHVCPGKYPGLQVAMSRGLKVRPQASRGLPWPVGLSAVGVPGRKSGDRWQEGAGQEGEVGGQHDGADQVLRVRLLQMLARARLLVRLLVQQATRQAAQAQAGLVQAKAKQAAGALARVAPALQLLLGVGERGRRL